AYRKQYRFGSYPLRDRSATRSQRRLSEVHGRPYLEPVLILQRRLAGAAFASLQCAVDQPDEVPASPGFLSSCLGFHLTYLSSENRSMGRSCPLWVKSRHSATSERCPLYPQKRTLVEHVAMSAMCQKRTFCAAVKNVVIRSLVGACQQRLRHSQAKRSRGAEK